MKKGIDAMLRTLDPYTVFIPESDVEDYRMTHISAEYGGIGALVHERDGAIEVSEVYEGFRRKKPAYRWAIISSPSMACRLPVGRWTM